MAADKQRLRRKPAQQAGRSAELLPPGEAGVRHRQGAHGEVPVRDRAGCLEGYSADPQQPAQRGRDHPGQGPAGRARQPAQGQTTTADPAQRRLRYPHSGADPAQAALQPPEQQDRRDPRDQRQPPVLDAGRAPAHPGRPARRAHRPEPAARSRQLAATAQGHSGEQPHDPDPGGARSAGAGLVLGQAGAPPGAVQPLHSPAHRQGDPGQVQPHQPAAGALPARGPAAARHGADDARPAGRRLAIPLRGGRGPGPWRDLVPAAGAAGRPPSDPGEGDPHPPFPLAEGAGAAGLGPVPHPAAGADPQLLRAGHGQQLSGARLLRLPGSPRLHRRRPLAAALLRPPQPGEAAAHLGPGGHDQAPSSAPLHLEQPDAGPLAGGAGLPVWLLLHLPHPAAPAGAEPAGGARLPAGLLPGPSLDADPAPPPRLRSRQEQAGRDPGPAGA